MRAAVVIRGSSAAQAPDPQPVQAAPRRAEAAKPSLITSRRQLIKLGAAATACLCCPAPLPAAADAGWGYSCLGTPTQWEGACAEGIAQSPINLAWDPSKPPKADGSLKPLTPVFPRYIKKGCTVKNTGHGTMQVCYRCCCCTRFA